ncbi:hypothetical protein HYW67_04190 [Candidatus Parcubacteria bacterium]|nr:hypothetical protein [Candidatus Parcubacteria bacterium]
MRKSVLVALALAILATVLGAPESSAAKNPPKPAVAAKAKPVVKPPAKAKPVKVTGKLYRGTVKEVYPEDLMFALRPSRSKLPYAVHVLNTTKIVSSSGRKITFEQLTPGQRISVRGSRRGTTIQATSITVEG